MSSQEPALTSNNQERQEDKALRDQIAQAIHAQRCLSPEDCIGGVNDDFRLADVVLPVVQAHTQALRAALGIEKRITAAFKGWRGEEVVEAKTNLTAQVEAAHIERDAALADLSSLRSAVAHLADDLDDEARAGVAAFPNSERHETQAGALYGAARRLRFLLPQEGPDK